MITCSQHPGQQALARGKCKNCYQAWWRALPANRDKERAAGRSPEQKERRKARRRRRELSQDQIEKRRTKLRNWRRRVSGTAAYKLSTRRSNLRRYGISLEDYNALLLAQQNRCAICRHPETEILRGEPRPLNVDHDHVTGKVRGLLCSECNKGIGNLEHSVEHLKAAITYLSVPLEAPVV